MEDTTPSGREMDILKVLWELGPSSVRDLPEDVPQQRTGLQHHPDPVAHHGRERARLAQEEGRTFIYTPRYSRQRAASRFLEHVFDGRWTNSC